MKNVHWTWGGNPRKVSARSSCQVPFPVGTHLQWFLGAADTLIFPTHQEQVSVLGQRNVARFPVFSFCLTGIGGSDVAATKALSPVPELLGDLTKGHKALPS